MKKYYSKLFSYWPYFVIFFVSSLLCLVWFHEKKYLGGGDVGLPFYDPTKTLQMAKYLWWGNIAPGFSYSQTLSSLPLYFFLSLVQQILKEPFLIQAFLTFVVLGLGGISFYLLIGELLPNQNKWWRLFAVGSYYFSAYMMDSVWHRFVYTTIILTAVLPLTILLFIKLLKTNRLFFLLFIQLVLIFFSYIFGTFSHVFTLWITLLVFALLFKYISPEKTLTFKTLFFWYLFSLVTWILFNLWWIIPQFQVTADLFYQYTSLESNLDTLVAISEKLPIHYVIRGINTTYFFDKNVWGEVYSNRLFFILSWLPSIVILIGLLLQKKHKKYIAFFFVWLLIIFVAKGTGPPLGGIFKQLFTLSFFVGIYRNAFEKIGILIPFFGSILLMLSWQEIYKKTNRLVFYPLLFSYIISVWFIFLWPFWTGNVFGEIGSRNVINPPESYKEINDEIKDTGQYRVLHLPLTEGGVSYKWNPPYGGIDPLHTLFDQEIISNTFGVKYIDAALSTLSKKIAHKRDPNSILLVLQALSVKYVILHTDVEWKERGLAQTTIINQRLNELPFLELSKETDELMVYKVKDDLLYPKIYFTEDVHAIYPPIKDSQELLWSYFDDTSLNSETYVSNYRNTQLQNFNSRFYFLVEKIEFPETRIVQPENIFGELLHIRVLPTSPLYPLIRFKEKLESFEQSPSEIIPKEINLTGKRIVEVYKLVERGDLKRAETILEEYDKRLDKILKWQQESGLVKPAVLRHYYVLKEAERKVKNNTFVSDYIEVFWDKLSRAGILPYYKLGEDFEIFNKTIFRFAVFEKGKFEVLLEKPPDYNLLEPLVRNGIEVYFDGRKETRRVKETENYLSLGDIDLEPGTHEVAYTPFTSENLIDFKHKTEIALDSDEHSVKTLEFTIKHFSADASYRVNFDQWSIRGNGASYRILQDSDPVIEDKRIYSFERVSGNDIYTYNWYWGTTDFTFDSRSNSQEGSLEFVIYPWDDCIKNLIYESRCKNERYRFQKVSQVKLRNISVSRVFNPKVVLANADINADRSEVGGYISNIVRENPARYRFDLSVIKPGLLVFSESFYPKWELFLNGERMSMDNHLIGNVYANSWYIENPGDYSGEIVFSPQRDFEKYILVSIVFGFVSFLTVNLLAKFVKRNYVK